MKEYKALKPFSSPRLGNVNAGDSVHISDELGAQMAENGYLIESKPAPTAEKKETKPAKPVAKKSTKKD